MALLKQWRTTPPGLWTYLQKETQLTIKAENGDALVALVIAHRQYKDLHPQDAVAVRLEIERQICVRLGNAECRAEPNDSWTPQNLTRPIFTMGKVISFSKAALEFVRAGLKMVPKAEAERRADICKGCVQNRFLSGCACSTFHKLIAAAIPEDRKIDGIFVCWACGCDLQSLVNMEESVIVESDKGRHVEYPSFCWKRKIIEDHAAYEKPEV